MATVYDKHYQKKNLFGNPYPELIDFFSKYPQRGKLLDIGCGQGKNAISLAKLGFSVTGIDVSKVGIKQMNRVAKAENLTLIGKVEDMFEFNNFTEYDFILFDNMFHFNKRDREKEIAFIQKIVLRIQNGCLLIMFVQIKKNTIEILNHAIHHEKHLDRLVDKSFDYVFKDKESGHGFKIKYQMIVVKK